MQEQAAAVIVAAGTSRRMGGIDKIWMPLAGRLTLARTIEVFELSPLISHIILVVNADRLTQASELCAREGWVKIGDIIAGGKSRQDSARNGLDHLAVHAPETRWVMIHDGARPLVSSEILEAGMHIVQEQLAAVAAVPIRSTIKQAQDGKVQTTLDRSLLWAVQTPQIFAFSLIHQAHHSSTAENDATDDAVLIERQGHPVAIFAGSYSNLKVTTPEDLLIAEALIRGSNQSMISRVGTGHDFHSFTSDSPLILGGVVIPYDRGLGGDVVNHVIVDALLGAAALGDIGQLFPTSNPRWKDQPSSYFLECTVDLLSQQGWQINNIDVTIIAARPYLATYIPAMRARVAEHLKLEIGQVSIKATTTDGLGFVGRGEGIASHAIAFLKK